MTTRTYTVEEVNMMRRAIEDILTLQGSGITVYVDPKLVEARLQSYMIAGVDPKDLAPTQSYGNRFYQMRKR